MEEIGVDSSTSAMTSRAGARRWLARWYDRIKWRGDGYGEVDKDPGGTNDDIALDTMMEIPMIDLG